MADVVHEIKARLNIEDLVGQYVQLKKAGRNYKGLCPFHSEKTPSFVVSPDKQIAYCFGCHKGGDLFKFLEELEGVDFPAAVKILAEKAGVKLEKTTFSKYEKNKGEKQKLIDAHEATKKFYVEQLWETKKGAKVLKYIQKRGLSDETIKDFEIGFSPDSFSETHEFLLKNKFEKADLITGGLVSRKDTTANKIYDRFRSRLMFPIHDALGRAVGFGGRALKTDDEPKYLNSAETPIYHKSTVLFGFAKAKQYIKKANEVVLVEGYMDLLMSYQAGIKNVVAVSGTALTSNHLKILKRIASKLVFAFDSDGAGMQAAKRAFLLADKVGMQTYMVDLQGKKDPADFILENSDAWADLIKVSKPFMEIFLDSISAGNDIKTIEGKKDFLDEALPYLSVISSSVEKDFYLRYAASLLMVNPQVMYQELKHFSETSRPDNEYNEDESQTAFRNFSVSDHLLALLLAFPSCFNILKDELKEDAFEGGLSSIYKEFLSQYNSQRASDDLSFDCDQLTGEEREKAMLLILFGEEKNAYLSGEKLIEEARKLFDRLKKTRNVDEENAIIQQIKEAQKNADKELINELNLKLMDLISKRSASKNT